ncbi:tortifolia1-like protein 4 [Quercus suber]|uniref:Tortifolia1-like protein 4 n=1 Tax=Quercus suber TaxID=58331 RepID=A0AAW0KD38_QUESU
MSYRFANFVKALSIILCLMNRFIGSSQIGINSLEVTCARLEMALDELSHDLTLSNGRIPNTDSAENTCCKLAGAEFLST